MSSFRAGRILISSLFFVLLCACAGKILQVDKSDEVLKTEEFDSKINVVQENPPPPPEPVIKEVPEKEVRKSAKKKKAAVKKKEKPKVKGPRQPDIEDSEGFDGRRPIVDPYRVGEKVIFDVSYFNINAGTISMEVKPFVTVNGKKAYHFMVSGSSNSFFSKIYAVDDKLETYVSYDDMLPLSLQVSIKESKQLAEARTFFDWKNMKASYWQKRITKEKGERSKKIDWEIKPYSQNVVSVAYYLRAFKLEPGKKHAVRIADEGKNIVFTGEVLRREKLKTPVGELATVVVSPRITADGVFKPIGEILLWFTDDDQKLLVRLESKIKIGTIVAKARELERGKDLGPAAKD
jgi:hypothetical protein